MDWRVIERNLLLSAFPPNAAAAPQKGAQRADRIDGIRPAIAPSSRGLSQPTPCFLDRWPELTAARHNRGSPSGFWTQLVALEPALNPFSFGGRLSRERLIARFEIIIEMRSLWSTFLDLDEVSTIYIDGVARDALDLVYSVQDGRRSTPPTPHQDWQYAWPDMTFCILCWHLVPRAPQSGFHRHQRGSGKKAKTEGSGSSPFRFRGQDALCPEHRPSIGKETRARWKKDQSLSAILLAPAPAASPTWTMVTPDDLAIHGNDAVAWKNLMATSFPRTSKSFPSANAGLRETMIELSGLPEHAAVTLSNAFLDHTQEAGLKIIAMLASCEKTLLLRQA